jgi:outer membrane protein OmpA-like peptidoglycan-associated protein
MKLRNEAGRLFILSGLLTIGLGLIWYVGHYLYVGETIRAGAPALSGKTNAGIQKINPLQADVGSNPTAGASAVASERGKQIGSVTPETGLYPTANPILFNSGASTLRDASIPELDKICLWLKENPDIELEIIGHADDLGIAPANQKVSEDRATAVEDYLVSQGIDRSRLKPRGVGSLYPIASNDTLLGRQANRRVEFFVVKSQAVPEPHGQESGK